MKAALAFVAVFVAFGYVGQDDYEESIAQEKHYCEMVKQWRDNPDTGWPPFRTDINCGQFL